MNTIENAKNETCRLIVKLTPKWENVPEDYKEHNKRFNKSQIISHICEKYIEMVAKAKIVPTILIDEGELEKEDFNRVTLYAKKLGLIIIYKEQFLNEVFENEKIKIVDIMEIFKKYSYGEKKWELVARRRLAKEIAELEKMS